MWLDWNVRISEYDKSDYFGKIMGFPEQCMNGWNIGNEFKAEQFKGINKIIVSGMGGSGYSGQLLGNLLKENKGLPVVVISGYNLPEYADRSTLTIGISYSGNTEETLSVMKQVKEKEIPFFCITSGGEISELYPEKSIIVPKGYQPRQATGYLFFSMLAALKGMGLVNIRENDVMQAIALMRDEQNSLAEMAKNYAEAIDGGLPVVYATESIAASALRWQTEINEIGKSFCHANIMPELQHNEINAFKGLEKAIFFFMHLKNESEQMKKRLLFQERRINEIGHRVIDIEAKGKTLLQQIWYANYLGTLTAFYLSMLYGIDPTPVELIDGLKEFLKK